MRIPSRASIVIPACNEAGRIRGLLETLSDPMLEGRIDTYVVCNGCTDDTRQVAEEYEVTVVEIADAGKHYALNEGDRLAGDVFPRLYCDADLQVTPMTILTLVESLATNEVRAAGPEIRYGVEKSSRPVKMFYRAEECLILKRWQDEHLTGRGLYGASGRARRRFTTFPGLIADDLFFDSQFTSAEKVVPPGTESVLCVPTTLRQLMHDRVRVAQGNHEHRVRMMGDKGTPDAGVQPRTWFELKIRSRVRRVRSWLRDLRRRDVVPMLFYLSVITGARAVLVVKKRGGHQVNWR